MSSGIAVLPGPLLDDGLTALLADSLTRGRLFVGPDSDGAMALWLDREDEDLEPRGLVAEPDVEPLVWALVLRGAFVKGRV